MVSLRDILCLFILFAYVYNTNGQTDATLEPEAKGKDVAEAVVRKLKRSDIFGEDRDFARRVAFVESTFGEDSKTYRPGFHGGIWQTEEDLYDRTKNFTDPVLRRMHGNISTYFRINWNETTWESLRTPLFSGLAFRLFINGVLKEDITGTVNNQSALWKRDYNRNNSLTQADFIRLIRDLEKEPICRGRMDICILLDGSGSVTEPNFNTAKGFVADLVNTFDIGNDSVKTGLAEYSTAVRTIFPVENNFNKSELDRRIRAIRYVAGSTNTAGAILRAVELLTSVIPRSGVPRVMTVLTDGDNREGNLPAAIEQARRNEIYSFAVGIGPDIRRSELLQIAYGDPSHVFESDSFEALSEFFYRLNTETCTIPQKPEINETVHDALVKGERRYYLYTVPENGMTVRMSWSTGRTIAYYSFTEEVPSSAINDGKSEGGWFYIGKPADGLSKEWIFSRKRSGETVYIAIEGIDGNNEYTFEIESGDQSTDPEPTTTLAPEPTTYGLLFQVSN